MPVIIQNTDSTIDLDVRIAENVTIDTSTPLDVSLSDLDGNNKLPVAIDSLPNVTIDTSTPLDVSVQGTPNVSVTNNVSIDDSTPIDVNISNSSINTNATIQGTPNVNVSSGLLFNYNMIYDGTTWRFQRSEPNGRGAITFSRTYWSSSDISSMGASTDINEWLAAYNDGFLTKKYIETYNDEFQETVYYQHPSLGNGSKSLRLIFQYSTQNSQKVVQSVHAAVKDWTFNDEIEGSVSISASNINAVNPSQTIYMHTPVADLNITDNTFGDVTLTLTGANSNLYHIHNTTAGTNGSTLPYIANNSYQIHTAGTDFSGESYSHALTVTATGTAFGVSDSVNIVLTGTYSQAVTYNNLKYVKSSNDTTGDNFTLVGTNKNPFEDNNDMPYLAGAFSFSCWLQVPSNNNVFDPIISFEAAEDTRAHFKFFHYGNTIRASFTDNGTGSDFGSSYTAYNEWKHVTVVKLANKPRNPNYNSSDQTYFIQIYIDGVATNPTTLYWDNSPTFGSGDWNGFTVGKVFLFGQARSYTSSSKFNRSGTHFKLDELAFYNKELSSSEASAIYNNGISHDLTQLASSYNLSKYFRFGDHLNDVNTVGSLRYYDEVNNTVYFEEDTNTNGQTEDYDINQEPYYPGANGNTKYVFAAYRAAVSQNTNKGNYFKDVSSTGVGFFPSLESSNAFRSSNNVSYSFYIKQTNTTNNFKSFISERYYTSQSNQAFFEIFSYGPELRVYSAYNSLRNYKGFSNALSANTWHHIVVTTNTADVVSGATVYVDGQALTATGSDTSNTIDRTGAYVTTVNFGGAIYNKDTSTSTFSTYSPNGQFHFDSFSTWNKTLTSSEVAQLYNGGQFKNPTTIAASSNLERWFRVGEVTGDGVNLKDSQDVNFSLAVYNNSNNVTDH